MNAGSQIDSILHPVRAAPRTGPKAVNHSANNRNQLKATQVRNQLKREEEEAKAAEAPFKMARFRGVESVLRQKSAEGTLGQGISRGGDGSASAADSRRTGNITSKMAGLSVRGPASAQRGTQQRGAGAKAATMGGAGAPPQRQQYDDEESIYAQGGGGGQVRGMQQQQQYDDEDGGDGGGDFSPRDNQYEDGGRFDDEAEQEYTRQQQYQGQGPARGRPQYDDEDEDIHGLAAQGPRGNQAAPASRGGIASMRIPAGLQAQQHAGGGGGGAHDGRSFINENARKVIQSSKAMASARSNQSDERVGGGGGGAGAEPLGQFLSSHPASAPAPAASISKHANYGQVPAYIRAQQSDMAAAKARAAEQAKEKDLGIPPGMILMPEDQRLHTLAVLQENHKKVLYDISCFPLRVETISRKKARADLEAKLLEIEKALQLFSRKRVLIQP